MSDFTRTVTLPGGLTFKYNSQRSFDQIIDDYNKHRPENYPVIRRGAPVGLRAALSGASREMTQATLAKKFPWQETIYSGLEGASGLSDKAQRMMADKQLVYFDPETNEIFTLDEPELTMGDVADVARPAANLTAEMAAGLTPVGKAGATAKAGLQALAARTGTVAGAGTAADQAYTTLAKFFWGLEDPRSMPERVSDAAGDFLTRAAFEAVTGGISVGTRAGAKKVGRGFAKREAVEEGLEKFERTFGQQPPSLGTLTGEDSKIQVFENYILSNYRGTAPKLRDAIEDTEGIIRRRIDETINDIMPGSDPTPRNVGMTVLRGIEGEHAGLQRLGAREGGWRQQFDALRGKLNAWVDEAFPSNSPVDVGPLKNLYVELRKFNHSPESLAPLTRLIKTKNPTAKHVREMMSQIGVAARSEAGMPSDVEAGIYARAKQVLEDAMSKVEVPAGETDAVTRYRTANRYAEQGYDELNNIMSGVTKNAKGLRTPAEVSKSLMTMVRNGDSDKLGAFITKLEPDEADFVRQGLISELLTADTLKTTLKRWRGLGDDMKDLLAPQGTPWRRTLDDVVEVTGDLNLLNRTPGSASTLTQAQQGLGLTAIRKAMTRMRGATGGILNAAAIGGLITGNASLSQALAMGGVGVGLAASGGISEVAKRAGMKGAGALLRSRPYMEWVGSVTKAVQSAGRFNTADAAMDFMISLMPRATAEMTLHELHQVQELQDLYLEVLHDAELGGQPKDETLAQIPPVQSGEKPQGLLAAIPPVTVGR